MREPKPRLGGTAGVMAVVVMLAVGEMLAAMADTVPSFVVAVADFVIDFAPASVVQLGIRSFGLYDKTVLLLLVVAACLLFGRAVGRAAAGLRQTGLFWLAALGFTGVAAATRDPLFAIVPTLAVAAAGVTTGATVLAVLLRLAGAPAAATTTPAMADTPTAPAHDRRAFLLAAGGFAALAGVAVVSTRAVLRGTGAVVARGKLLLPRAARSLPPVPQSARLAVRGISPLITPNRDFYRIDTALLVPNVDPEQWSLKVTGMVDRPYRISFAELLEMPMVEADVTLSCVSNIIGGGLVGTARWLGTPLAPLLERAGVDPRADQVVGRSVDGFTAGFPVSAASDGRTALVAVGMNGEPLPLSHGFPARLVVAGLYGYVSATKWLSELHLTRFDSFDGYWVPRGWSAKAPIKTQSRIDVPRHGQRVVAGTFAVAGVAWAPPHGIRAVEVRVDEEPWAEARLAAALSDETWRQWVYRWEATPGEHVLQVRATDGRGRVQTAERQGLMPDGATGHDDVLVRVQRP